MIKPYGERIIVQVEEIKERITASGIIIPEMAQKRGESQWGDVCAVGDVEGISEGDRVMFSIYAGTKIAKKDGLLVLKQGDIIAIEDSSS